ncbi:O-methyltransferase [Raineya sp.]|jgi:predicted O-methyltransferase YrrM
MELLADFIQKYAEIHTSPENDVLKELNRQTHLKVLMPRMLSGHLQGRFLAMISQMLAPNRILEIGTYTGYSALCLAEGLQENGKLITIDKNEELEDFAKNFFAKAGFEKKIEMLIGNALEIIPTLQETWDLVFIDADKLNYAKYYEMVLPQVRKGGWIIADNVLWSGKVADTQFTDKDTEALRAFNSLVQNDTRVENLLLPLRDGLMIARKL